MFHDLDATLAAMLDDSTAPAELRAAEVSFKTPDKDFHPTPTTVNFFLHGIQENRALRSSTPIVDRAGDQYVDSAPPMRVDCTYLVTTWSSQSGDLKIVDEHRLLGSALLWFSRFPTIPDALLQGALMNPPQLYAVTAVAAQTKSDESLAHFWSALGIAPRPTFALTVTVTMTPRPQVRELPAVDAVEITATTVEHAMLVGRVLDTALTPVASAAVTIIENNRQTTSDLGGRFRFGDLAFGTYTLLVAAPGRPDVRQAITYRPTGQVHNVLVPAP